MTNPNWQIFLSFFKIGALSFGGGPPSIPLIHKELVNNEHLSDQQFTEGLALGNAMPGPILTNMAVFAGMKMGGASAALAGVIGAVLPSALLMGVAAFALASYHDQPSVQSALKAIRPAVIAMLLFTVYKLAPNSIFSVSQAVMAAAVFLALVAFNLHPALGILAAGIAGMIIYR